MNLHDYWVILWHYLALLFWHDFFSFCETLHLLNGTSEKNIEMSHLGSPEMTFHLVAPSSAPYRGSVRAPWLLLQQVNRFNSERRVSVVWLLFMFSADVYTAAWQHGVVLLIPLSFYRFRISICPIFWFKGLIPAEGMVFSHQPQLCSAAFNSKLHCADTEQHRGQSQPGTQPRV